MTVPNMTLEYRLTVRRPDGSTRTATEGTAESFLLQYLEIQRAGFTSSTQSGVTDTSGTDRTVKRPTNTSGPFLELNAGSGVKDRGLVIGSGTAAVSISDFQMDTPLTASVGYSATDIQAVQTSPPDATIAIQRDFTNNTGSTSTVTEVGAIVSTTTQNSTTTPFLIVRDTIPSTDVGDNETASLEYIFSITA
jgi:hypothetical protein